MQRLIVLTMLAVLCAASVSFAEPIEALWQLRADETLEEGAQRATQHALREAVFKKALELVPGKLGQEREELLREYLDGHAARIARVEGEPSLSERVDGMVLRADVVVDEAALRSILQRTGVFFTAGITLPYSLTMEKAPEGSAEALARLEKLTGVAREEGAVPRLHLSHDGVLWKGAMEGGRGAYEAAGSDLETLWVTLWGWYFMVHGPDAGPSGADGGAKGTVQLVVEGFSAPDQVYAFEHVLQGFRPAISGAALKAMNMRPEGVAAIWNVELLDESLLRQRLDAYAPSRGLAYQLVGLPDAPPPPSEPGAPASEMNGAPTPPESQPESPTQPGVQSDAQPDVQPEAQPGTGPEAGPSAPQGGAQQ